VAQAAGPAAQDVPPPPEIGEPLFHSSLAGPDLFDARDCPTTAANGEYVGEGFRLRVRGRCVQTAPAANLPVPARGLVVQDHDVAVDFKVAVGSERASLNLFTRIRNPANLLAAHVNVGSQQVEIQRRDANQTITVAASAVGIPIEWTEWNRVALRTRGTEAWLLLNDVPLLYTSDVDDQPGGVGLEAIREGRPDDNAEVSIVFRELTVSSLAD
jgi:hypothetical protein